ncbi:MULTISPECIES: universal stress protein [unclassified Streptomyces]|uniref:universal stress protein n=1 Tax=unclassified Streptomyces TaxID=2593676 RepID=UPI00168BD6FD|nr:MULTISPECIES: universal stress protein [unclassified Streptomyces]MBD3002556.1 universal stress protein [Streptomyces sp. 5-10]
MPGTVTVGLDGSPESLAAADWAACEAQRRELPLRLVHALDWHSFTYAPLTGVESLTRWAERLPSDTAARLRRGHPGLRVVHEQVAREPVPSLLAAAENAELLVLGSRGLSRVTGLLVGSVALSVVARAEPPVVLVRTGGADRGGDRRTRAAATASPRLARRDVVLGLDLRRPAAPVLDFAFDAAARRAATLRVIHGWSPSSASGCPALFGTGQSAQIASELTDVLRPWQAKFPGVEVSEQAVVGSPAGHLVDASAHAVLMVVGRFTHGPRPGPSVGPVTHSVLHHSSAPVAVIAHG